MNTVAMERFRRSLRDSLYREVTHHDIARDEMFRATFECRAPLEELAGQAIPTFLDLELWLELKDFRAGTFMFNLADVGTETNKWDVTYVVYQAECEAY